MLAFKPSSTTQRNDTARISFSFRSSAPSSNSTSKKRPTNARPVARRKKRWTSSSANTAVAQPLPPRIRWLLRRLRTALRRRRGRLRGSRRLLHESAQSTLWLWPVRPHLDASRPRPLPFLNCCMTCFIFGLYLLIPVDMHVHTNSKPNNHISNRCKSLLHEYTMESPLFPRLHTCMKNG